MDVDIAKLIKDEALSKTPLQIGKEIEGTLIAQDRTKLYVDLSPWGTGIIYKIDLQESPFEKNLKHLAIGQAIKARVVDIENEEGLIELSLKELSAEAAIEELQNKFQQKETIAGKVIGANKGGLLVEIRGITGFLPSSQLAPEHYPRASSGESEEILKKLKTLVGSDLSLRILSIDEGKQTFVASEKAAMEKDLRQRLEKFQEGDVVQGEVTSVTDFGVFVKFAPGIEGLVHISELDWKLINHPKEIVKVGDGVTVKVIKIKNGEVSLSIRALKRDPWLDIEKKYNVGDRVKATVRELHPFGAFAFLDDQIHGLVHISQFGSPKHMEKVITAGKEYDFEITSIVLAEHRMGLKLIMKEPKSQEEKTSQKEIKASKAPKKEKAAKKETKGVKERSKTAKNAKGAKKTKTTAKHKKS